MDNNQDHLNVLRKIKNKKIKALFINTRNANTFTGKNGFQGLKEIADELSNLLTIKKY